MILIPSFCHWECSDVYFHKPLRGQLIPKDDKGFHVCFSMFSERLSKCHFFKLGDNNECQYSKKHGKFYDTCHHPNRCMVRPRTLRLAKLCQASYHQPTKIVKAKFYCCEKNDYENCFAILETNITHP